MARRYRRGEPIPIDAGPQGKVLTAAVQILNGPKVERFLRKATKGEAWQRESWLFYDEVPEYAFGVDALAQSVSKVRLIAGRTVTGFDEPETVDGEPTSDENGTEIPATEIEIAAADLVAGFAGGPDGQQAILERVVTHLQVAAESYIVGRDMPDGTQVWDAFSNEEVSASSGGWKVDDGVTKFTLADTDVLIRVWLAHPMRRSRVRSFSMPLLSALHEVRGLTMSIAATTDSRLAGAGILFISQSTDLNVEEVMDAMITPIKDRESAAAVVPIIARVPDETFPNPAIHMRFEPTNDLKEQEKRADAILRVARGMPLPQEQILGMGESNHWSLWGIDEATIKGPVTSFAAVVMRALTIGWFRPALETRFDPEMAADYSVWFDASPLAMRPDRSGQAAVALDHLMISSEAFLRESGLDKADLPDGEDFCRQLLIKLLLTSPAQAAQWFAALGECAGFGEMDIDLSAIPAGEGNGRQLPQAPAQSDRVLPEQNGVASGL